MKPLLAQHAKPLDRVQTDVVLDRDTFESPIHQALLVGPDIDQAKSTLITLIRNETTDDN